MANEGFKRKLTAILSADAVGYSRLMRENEEATVRDIATHRVLITEIIQQHHGRVIDSPGDNLLAEFASVVDAVNGAIKIQEKIKKSNADTPENRRMEFRIGINLGDVIEEEDRIYGDGVNIAARVEGLASAGGIAISGTVYEHIKEKLSLGYQYLGEQDVKNISEPVRVYWLLTEPDDAGKLIGEEKLKSRKFHPAALSALALIVLIAGALVIWNNYFRIKIEPASINKMAYPLPEKPSVAVLPFDNMSDDPDQEYFCDGLTEEIITGLSKVPSLFVIARNSSFTYKGKPVNIQKVSEELGVRYVLEGSVRKVENRVRITAQLIDAVQGHHVWAERYDRNLIDIFALQDEITLAIIQAMQVELTEGEQASVTGKGTENLGAYLKANKAHEQFYLMNKEGSIKAKKLANEALALDPNYAFPYATLANAHMLDVWFGFSEFREESMRMAAEAAQKALALDTSDPRVYHTLTNLYIMQRQYEKAIASAESGLKLSPSSAQAHNSMGLALSFAGEDSPAIPFIEQAIRLDPYPSSVTFRTLGSSYRAVGRYEEAIIEYKKALQQTPDDIFTHLGLASTYMKLGLEEEARNEAKEVIRIHPGFSLNEFAKSVHDQEDQSRMADYIESLREAGLPD